MTTIQIIALIGIMICGWFTAFYIGRLIGRAQGYFMGWDDAEQHHGVGATRYMNHQWEFTEERLN